MTADKHRRFLEEAKILVQLNHRNIMPVLGWCDSRRLMAMVGEWRDGVNVETWLSTTAPPWRQRVQVISGIASGICYLHRAWPELGFDLKTRHIFLSEDGEPLITRFTLLPQNHHGSAKKTYKLGLFLLEMVANRKPSEGFKNTTEGGFVEWVKWHYPRNLKDVIHWRMEKKMMIDDVSEAVGIIKLVLMCTDQSSRRSPAGIKSVICYQASL